MTELVGSFTCGAHTLALRAMASAQHMREPAVYFDLEHCFDPDYAAGCGVDMDKLIVVRPHAITEALDIAQEMIESGMSGILVWDSVEALLAAAGGRALFPAFLRRLVTPLAVSSGVMLVLNSPEVAGVEALKHHAALRLGCRTTRWLREYQDITGYETQVTVLKNRFGPEGDGVELRIAV
jgi:recombination protein RecA